MLVYEPVGICVRRMCLGNGARLLQLVLLRIVLYFVIFVYVWMATKRKKGKSTDPGLGGLSPSTALECPPPVVPKRRSSSESCRSRGVVVVGEGPHGYLRLPRG